MNELIARLCEAMGNPNMREDLSATMQALLYDPTLMIEEEGAERSPLRDSTNASLLPCTRG